MAREIEIKVALDDPARLRARLHSLGAAGETPVFEVNSIFDTPDGRLRTARMALRLREIRSVDRARVLRTVLTLKRPVDETEYRAGGVAPAGKTGSAKIREEIETDVAGAPAMASILAALGYRPAVIYEKRRETFRCAACEIVIDELPCLGWFAEIEGPTQAAVESAAADLGLDAAPPIDDTYIALAVRAGAAVEDRRELRFP